jgi:hypothetical protein
MKSPASIRPWPLHRLQVIGLGELALGREGLGLAHLRRADRVLQLLLQLAQALLAVRVRLGLAGVGVHDQVQLARQVVDDRQLLALQQQDVGAAQGVGRAALFQLLLDVAHHVVAEVAGQAAAEPRQARTQGHLEAALVGRDEVQRVALGALDHLAVGDHLGHRVGAEAGGAQQRAGGQADEAVAAEALAAHHRFQQEAVAAVALGVGQLQVQRQGGFEVGERLRYQWDAVVALQGQTLEFEFGDHG